METVKLPLELVNNVVAYLGTRPFNEVAKLIGDIQMEYAAQKEPQKKEEKE